MEKELNKLEQELREIQTSLIEQYAQLESELKKSQNTNFPRSNEFSELSLQLSNVRSLLADLNSTKEHIYQITRFTSKYKKPSVTKRN